MYVDSHCHLNYTGLVEHFDDVIQRAKDAHVSHMVCICSRLDEFPSITKLTEHHDNIYCSVGIHPHDCGESEIASPSQLVELARHPKVIGIGETGLDFFYENSPEEKQIENFKNHIKAARETNLPIIIHTREADNKTIEILKKTTQEEGPFPGLIHCFSTDKKVADCALELGFYISISGIITFKNADNLRDIVKKIPLERLLIETDAPFLAPVPKRGRTNEPSFIPHTAKMLADLFDLDSEELGRITSNNFFKLFTKAQF